MKISEKVLGIIILILIFGGIFLSSSMENWKIEAPKVAEKKVEAEVEFSEIESGDKEYKVIEEPVGPEEITKVEENNVELEEVIVLEEITEDVEEVIVPEEITDVIEEVIVSEEITEVVEAIIVTEEITDVIEEVIFTEETVNYIYNDGVYIAMGRGYKSYIEVSVEIIKDEIINVEILSHNESRGYYEEAVTAIPKAIMSRQNADVDMVSGATYTSRAIIEATKEALENAKK